MTVTSIEGFISLTFLAITKSLILTDKGNIIFSGKCEFWGYLFLCSFYAVQISYYLALWN